MANDEEPATRAEALSALVDGEIGRDECQPLVDRLIEDRELQQHWSRWHAERAALAGIRSVGPGFAARVQAAVAEEPPIVAGRPVGGGRTAAGAGSGASGVVTVPGWLKPVAGVAVAASVAMAAVGSLLALRDGGVGDDLVVADAGEQVAPPTGIETVSASTASGADAAADRDEVRRRLAVYLSNHNEYAGAGGMPGVMPYSRQVGLNAGR